MTDEYTPTVEEVRDQWASSPRYRWAVMLSDRFADFDRMIAQVERAAAVKALREAAYTVWVASPQGPESEDARDRIDAMVDALVESGEGA